MARRPSSVRVRSYNVGFGDCFLLSFAYAGGRRHVLIDFGSTKLPARAPDDHLEQIAKQIAADTGGKLHVVVATHRHADHVSGFGKAPGRIIRSLRPELVVQPWTEDPALAPDAIAPAPVARDGRGPHGLVAQLADMQAVARAVVDQVPGLKASDSVRKAVREQLGFLGETNLPNSEAVEALMTMGARPPVYASFGSRLPLADLLPGVRVHVLGPPTLAQSAAIATQRARDPDEFWQLAAAGAEAVSAGGGGGPPPFTE
jgi:hypothetical protein